MIVVSRNECSTLGELRALLDVLLSSADGKALIINMKRGDYKVRVVEGLEVD